MLIGPNASIVFDRGEPAMPFFRCSYRDEQGSEGLHVAQLKRCFFVMLMRLSLLTLCLLSRRPLNSYEAFVRFLQAQYELRISYS